MTQVTIKLEYYGVGDEELSFFTSYLNNTKQCCNINYMLCIVSQI